MEKAKRGPDRDTGQRSQRSTPAVTLSDLRITRDQSSKWQKLAAVPQEDFDAALAAEAEMELSRAGLELLRRQDLRLAGGRLSYRA